MSPEPVPLQVLTWPSGRELARRLPRLLAGIVILGIGIAPILDAELGVHAVDVLHQGVARHRAQFGVVVVLVGIAVLLLWIPLAAAPASARSSTPAHGGLHHERGARPAPAHRRPVWRWVMLLGGLVVTALGVGLYIGCGLGPGPATDS